VLLLIVLNLAAWIITVRIHKRLTTRPALAPEAGVIAWPGLKARMMEARKTRSSAARRPGLHHAHNYF
jgi:hypothetical protein